jgi:GT2 family glycosyltransferase
MFWEDADYCRRVAKDGRTCTYLPAVSVRHMGGGSAKYVLPRAVRAFHRSAFHLYWKHAGVIGRLLAPVVYAGLMIRAELRLRTALRRENHALSASTESRESHRASAPGPSATP